MLILQNLFFLIYVILIALAEVWMLQLVYRDTKKAYFLAISPLRWLAILILVSKYEPLGTGFLFMFLFIAAFYWFAINLLVNPIVLGQPLLFVGTDGMLGKLFNNLFGRNVAIMTLLIKVAILALTTHLYWGYINDF